MTHARSANAQAVILLVEDHPLFLDGVRRYLGELADDYELVVAESAAAASQLVASRSDLDIALVDLGLPDACGFELMDHIRQQRPALPVVVLSGSTCSSDIRRAFHAGAKGYITKDTQPEIMLSAMRLVMAGGVYVPPQLVVGDERGGRGDAADRFSQAKHKYDQLTERQQQVLRLLQDGRSNKDIADQIGCSQATVKVHVTAVLKTLAVPNRSGAAALAREFGLGDDPAPQ